MKASARCADCLPRPTADRFLDARTWGAPLLRSDTAIAAPFGWTGLVRTTAKLLNVRLGNSGLQISSFTVLPDGICLEVDAGDLTKHWSALNRIADQLREAAHAIDPETGLLNRPSLRTLLRYLCDEVVDPGSPLELAAIFKHLSSLSPAERDRCTSDIHRMAHGIPPNDVKKAPLLARWRLEFPVGAETVVLRGATAAHEICEPLIVVDHLLRWARGIWNLYRLRPTRKTLPMEPRHVEYSQQTPFGQHRKGR